MSLSRWRKSRLFPLVAALAVLPLSLTASAPAEAFPGENLFNKLADVLVKVGVNPDAIVMTRYTLQEPAKASSVFSHAAAQDYPFFALVGAVKAARDKTFPGIGKFDQKACNSPITAIDVVFGKADAYVDNAKGKQDTNQVVGAAKQYAADYAKATTAQAKEQAKDELAANIPYFGEIETICSFAFQTNFAIETAAINQLKSTVGAIQRTYQALGDGDFVVAAAEMFKLGANKQVTCAFIDSAVGGGIVGRTPVLGTLAKNACAGFVGTVIDGFGGIVKGGVGVVESGLNWGWSAGKAGVCEVYSWFGSGCSKPIKLSTDQQNLVNAGKWCAPYGGLKDGLFNGNDWSFTCNDNSMCRSRPGLASVCQVEADRQAWAAQQRQLIDLEFKAKLPVWQKSFAAKWQKECPLNNNQCRNQIAGIQIQTTNEIEAARKSKPNDTYAAITVYRHFAADNKARDLIEAEKFRVLPGAWKAQWDAGWTKKCPDAQCRDMALMMSDTIVKTVAGQKKLKPNQPYSAMSPLYAGAATSMGQEYVKALARTGKAGPGPIKVQPAAPPPGVIRLKPLPQGPAGN